MRSKYFLILFIFLFSGGLYATHERAGEITYEHLTGSEYPANTYRITITTFTFTETPADRDSLPIRWGDNTSAVLGRQFQQYLGNQTKMNRYTGIHTYPGMGTYIISMEDPNRNSGVINIPNSVDVPFYIESKLVIGPLGHNNSVQLTNYPIDEACVYKPFVHNPGAVDIDGDSIAYRITVCRGKNGQIVNGFTQPQAINSFGIDPYTGELLWDSPMTLGEYNVAFVIEEWREGFLVGEVTRDMQIRVEACTNNPPVIETLSDTCVLVDTELLLDVKTYDPDGDAVVLSATGIPLTLAQNAATASPNPVYNLDTAWMHFAWQPSCHEIRKNPYKVHFKSVDNANPVSLATYHTTNIKVIAPPVNIISATPLGTSISLDWTPSSCDNCIGYKIYRKSGNSNFVPSYCETGVPLWTGFELIQTIPEKETLSFTDDNNGEGLVHGIKYCYIVTPFFLKNAEGIASNIMCAHLKKDMPIITNVSIENTGDENGQIRIVWSKPTEIDVNQIPGPYEYRLYGKNQDETDYQLLATFDDLNDTVFVHPNRNTKDLMHQYKIDFYNMEEGNIFKIGTTPEVNSTFLRITPTNFQLTLSWNDDQPWLDDSTHIFRKNQYTGEYDSLVSVYNSNHFADTGLVNGMEYCYYAKTFGHYSLNGIVKPIVNFSQINCDTPLDNVPPCLPDFFVKVDCQSYQNEIVIQDDPCLEEDMMFYIHYMYVENNDYSEIIDSITDLQYTFVSDPPSIVGCFAISARDSLYNYTPTSPFQCVDIDSCNTIVFPPMISPNNDGYNDWFHAFYVNSIKNFNITVVNRWGVLVYESDDPYFQWDGKCQTTNNPCSTGTYYFVARFTEFTLGGEASHVVKGSLTILY